MKPQTTLGVSDRQSYRGGMPDLILANARLIDPETGYDGPGALRLSGGLIEDVAKGAAPAAPDRRRVGRADLAEIPRPPRAGG